MSHKIPYPMSPIAAAVSAALAAPGAALAQEDGASDVLDEIIVTATKLELNLQKVPASVQALPEAMLKEMGALNTQDYTRFMPSVNWISTAAGNNQLIFRGIHTSTGAFTMTRSSSIYLDEIPITSTAGDSPDIRMLDVSRVEALSGPQGTLFGAAAQSGILRIITNQPDTSQFEASADVTFSTGETSDPSHSITGVFNLPLIEDVFAIRIAAQAAEDGGFVDNVFGHTPDTWYGETAAESAAAANCDTAGDGGSRFRAWGCDRLNWGSHSNEDVVEENWNSAEHLNLRISARWEMSEAVAATVAYHYGTSESQGNSTYNPFVGDLQTIGFVKNQSEQEWEMTSLTIDADLGFAQFVSATSFYENQRTYIADNTLYYHYYMARYYCTDNGVHSDFDGVYLDTTDPTNPRNGAATAAYWLWEHPDTGRAIYNPRYCALFPAQNSTDDVRQLADIVGIGEGPEWQDRFTQEFRLSHQGETFDWLAGLYYEESNDSWNSVWMKSANVPFQESMAYVALRDCFEGPASTHIIDPNDPLLDQPVLDGGRSYRWGCHTGSNAVNAADPAAVAAALITADHLWDSRDDTDWETKAVFGELTWHATDEVNVTIGGRWFENTNTKHYTKWILGTTDSNDRHIGGYAQPLWAGDPSEPSFAKISEFVPKLSVTYTLSEDKMVYGLYTEGFRVGGTNRAGRNVMWDRTFWGQVWEPDKLKNYEMGLKSRWADNTVQLNLTYFYMDWEDFQHEVVDPSGGTCIDPALEPNCPGEQLPWLSIVGNVGEAHATGLQAELAWVAADGWDIGANALWLEREIDSVPSIEFEEEANLRPGQELPNSPELQGAVWATYTWPVQFIPGAEMFARAQYSYTGDSLSKLTPEGLDTANPQFTNPAYSIADLRFGLVSGDGNWQLDLFVNNITDERAQVTVSNSTGEYTWGRTGEYEHSTNVVTVRPREYGFRFTTRWGD